MENVNEKKISVLYADDDNDDFDFFESALADIKLNTELIRVNNGEEVLQHLKENHY